MKKYDIYKNSSIPWITAIPDHWDEKSLIQFAEEQQIKNTGMQENNLLSLSYGRIVKKDINTTDGLLPASFEGYQIVHNGNIILRLTDLQNDHKSLRTGLVTQTGIIMSAYTCIKTRSEVLPGFLQLALHVADIRKISLMQRIFQFENYVRGEAIKTIDLISGMGIVDNMDIFIALGERKALTNAKKLMKARNSPVLRMDKSVLIHKLNTLPRYKDKFVFEDGKIKISNQKQATDFLKMLNDSILKSELTDAEYDSTVKIELTPLGNEET